VKSILTAIGIAALALAGATAQVAAQDWPNRPIKIIVPYPPGGGSDIVTRIMAEALSPRLGQQVVVENKPGANGLIGTEAAASSPPDGYTLMSGSTDTLTIIPALKKDMPYDIHKLTYIAKIADSPMTITISSKLPAKNLEEFIAYAKANPGKLNYGANGIGGSAHLAVELFSKAAGIQMKMVAYKGMGNSMTDLIGGHIEMAPLTPVSVAPHVNSDKLRILALSGPNRNALIPNVPTLKELGYPTATVTNWYALIGPPNLPTTIADRLSKEIAASLTDPVILEKIAKLGATLAPIYREDYRKLVLTELGQWEDIAKSANIIYQE